MIATYYQGGSGRVYQTFVVSRTDLRQRQLKLANVARWIGKHLAPEAPKPKTKLMKYALKIAAISLVASILISCASSGMVKKASPIVTSMPVSLDFALVETSSSLGDVGSESQFLNQSIITGLSEREIFGVVSGNKQEVSAGSGLKVEVEIKTIKKVSDNARVWAGGLAGRASILIHVTVSDLISGKQIEVFDVEGKSGKSAEAGTTNEAIQQAANQVVVEMVKISMQTSE